MSGENYNAGKLLDASALPSFGGIIAASGKALSLEVPRKPFASFAICRQELENPEQHRAKEYLKRGLFAASPNAGGCLGLMSL
jgi:hypothetical protein